MTAQTKLYQQSKKGCQRNMLSHIKKLQRNNGDEYLLEMSSNTVLHLDKRNYKLTSAQLETLQRTDKQVFHATLPAAASGQK